MIFRFAHPIAFLLFGIPILLFILYRIRRWPSQRLVIKYSDLRLIEGLPLGWRVRFRYLPDVLRWAAWILLVFALARPQSGYAQEIIRGQGVDIVLALDISGSMAALDFDPQNRLAAAKQVISDFITAREFDRIGLVVFAQDSYHRVPPTLDYSVLLRSLETVSLAPELGLQDGTAIGLGLASAGNMLRQSDALSRVVILLTDGANNAGGIGPITAAQALAALGMRVYTVGVGKLGLVPIPDGLGGTRMIESDLDEAALQTVAQTTNGRYFRAVDLKDLQDVYAEIDSLERSDVEQQIYVLWQEQASLLLGLGFLSLIVERALRLTVFQSIL